MGSNGLDVWKRVYLRVAVRLASGHRRCDLIIITMPLFCYSAVAEVTPRRNGVATVRYFGSLTESSRRLACCARNKRLLPLSHSHSSGSLTAMTMSLLSSGPKQRLTLGPAFFYPWPAPRFNVTTWRVAASKPVRRLC